MAFHNVVGFEEWWAKFRYRARVSGLPRSFAKRPLTACRCVCMLTLTSERHGAERRQTLRREEPLDRVEPGHRIPDLREWWPAGSTGAAVPHSFSDGLRGHRSRSRKGQANRGEGVSPNEEPRGARSWKQRRLLGAFSRLGFVLSADAGMHGLAPGPTPSRPMWRAASRVAVMCADRARGSRRRVRAGWEEHWPMDCPLCLWALPPPHCHGALIFDGKTERCDRRGPGCRDIHPLGRRFQAEHPATCSGEPVARISGWGATPARTMRW